MRIGDVIGTVTATRKAECLTGQRLLLVQPLDEEGRPSGAPLVAIDTVSAAPGQRICFVEKREAAKAFAGAELPSDATILGVIDRIDTAP